jgi:hypothetical protein
LLIYIKQKARVYYARADRYIGTFDSREKAAFAYEIVRENLKSDTAQRPLDLEAADAAFKSARDAALEAVGIQDPVSPQKSNAVIAALNAASGGKNDRAAALAAEHMRGISKCQGKWVSWTDVYIFGRSLLIYFKQKAIAYYAGKARYIRNFESREKAAFAYEIVREKLKIDTVHRSLDPEAADAAFKSARDAALEAVGDMRIQDPVAHRNPAALMQGI